MSRLTPALPPLIGGVGQQSRIRRLPSQVARQENAWASPIDGLRKRHPIDHVAEVEEVPSDRDLVVHTVARGDESYVFVFGQGWIRAFTTEGTLVPVRGQAPSWVPDFSYLDQRHALNLLLAPETFVSPEWQRLEDALVPEPLDATGPLGFGSPVALVHDNQTIGNDGIYQQAVTTAGPAVRKHFSVYVREMEEAATTGIRLLLHEALPANQNLEAAWVFVEGVPTPSGTPSAGLSIDTEDVGGGWYRLKVTYQPDGIDDSLVDFVQVVALAQGALGPDRRVAAWGAQLIESDSYTLANFPPYIIADVQTRVRATTVQDFTFVTNSARAVQRGADTVPVNPGNPSAFVFVRQGSYAQQYRVRFQVTGFAVRNVVIGTWNGTTDPGQPDIAVTIATTELAAFIGNYIVAQAYTEVTTSTDGSVLRLLSTTSAGFDVFEVSDSFGDTALVSIEESIERFSDLPTHFVDGFRIRVDGDPTADEDDYFVQFVKTTGSGGFGEGTWRETAAPGSDVGLDPETMPHQLVRMFDDEVGTATGTPRALFFSWGPCTWQERIAGNDESNPFPSFTSLDGDERTIRDVFFFRQRLCFLSGLDVVMSEAGRFFNLFRTTVRVIVDADRIDVEAPHPFEKELHAAVPLDERCLVFGTRTIFVLDGQPVLTPRTVEIRSVVDLPSRIGPIPTAIDRGVLFVSPEGSHAALREAFPLNDRSSFATDNLSEQAPRYIPADVVEIRGRATEDEYLVFMRCASEPQALYVYKSYSGGGERLQSALWRYTTAGAILGMGWVDDRLFLVVNRSASALEELPPIDQIGLGDPVSKTWTVDADFDEGVLVDVNHDAPNNDQLQLDQTSSVYGFLMIPTQDGTIMRVDVATGDITGSYRSMPGVGSGFPGRCSVDSAGNTWAGNAAVTAGTEGSVVKIGLVVGGTRCNAAGTDDPTGEYLKPPFQYLTGIDRDSNGLIRTSRSSADALAWPDSTDGGSGGAATVTSAVDELILLYQRVAVSPAIRGLGLDAAGNVWSIGYDSFFPWRLSQLASADGSVLFQTPGSGFNPCGGHKIIVDATGVVWSTGQTQDDLFGGGPGTPICLLRYDPTTGGGPTAIDSGNNPFGLAEDSLGRIWIGNAGTLRRYNGDGTTAGTFTVTGAGSTLIDIAIDGNDVLWIACQGDDKCWRVTVDGTVVTSIDVGNAPHGVTIDHMGRPWVLCETTLHRIDPATNTVDLTVTIPAPATLFSPSSFAGSVEVGDMAPTGQWTAIHDGGAPGILWRTASWGSEEEDGSALSVFVRTAEDLTLLPSEAWVPVTNGGDFELYGRFAQVRVEFTRSSEVMVSPILFDISIFGLLVEEPVEPEIGAGLLNIEAMRVGSGIYDPGSASQVVLDRRFTDEHADVSISYDPMANETVYALPYVSARPEDLLVVTRAGLVLPVTGATPEEVRVFGDQLGVGVWIGERFRMEVELGRPVVAPRSGQGSRAPVLEGFEVLLGMTVYLGGPVHLDVEVNPRNGETYRQEIRAEPLDAGPVLGEVTERGRAVEVAIFGAPDDTAVVLANGSHLPTEVHALEWHLSKRQGSPRVT